MIDLKGINLAEFQKCGEIMVAPKGNQLAISCNFCQQLFKQVQAFMRHLQQRHNDKLNFVKQAKEVEVYAVEELINQTVASCVTDIESEESNPADDDSKIWSKEDMEWLEEGIVPKKSELHHRNKKKTKDDEEIGLDMTNMSILKALEDCDVSFNLMDNLNSTKCGEDENEDNKLENTLLSAIQNDWEDNDTNESIMQSIDCTHTEMTNITNHLMHFSNELVDDVSMTDVPFNSANIEKSLNVTKYNLEQPKDIKHLLQGLDDLEDLDSLLENLEGNSKTQNEKQTNQDLIKTNEINCSQIHQNFTYSKQLLEKANNIGSQDFESRLKKIKESLEDDNDDLIIKNTKQCKIKNGKHKNNFASKQRKLEDTLNYDKDFSGGISIANYTQNVINNLKITRSTDFEVQLKNLEESLNDYELIDLKETKTKGESNMPLNDDLTRALADALGDEDIDLLNMQFEQKNEEILNQDILSLLDKELNDKKLDQDSLLLNKSQSLEAKKKITISKNQDIFTRNVIKSKYQKTNLKAKSKIVETQNINVIQSAKSCVLQEFNTHNTVRIMKDSKMPLKGNHDIFLQQQQRASMNNSLISPTKISNPENLNGRISNNYLQRKTPNKENEENNTSINIRYIKQEKLTPITSFVKYGRGDKTPVKKAQVILKESPKTQEKDDILKIKTTPKRGYRTPQEGKIKQSPKTQEKQEFLNLQQTPKVPLKKTPELIKAKVPKQSPKTQEKPIPQLVHKTPENKNVIISKVKTPKTNTKTSSETQPSPKQTLIDRTPLTTPQRLKNVAIKLQRLSPEKFTNQVTKECKNSRKSSPQCINNNTKKTAKHFKLPIGISLTKLHRDSPSPEANNSTILETPVKTPTYCKQNFSESSLEPLQNAEKVNSSANKLEFSSIQAQSQIINNLNAEANSSLVRQRKASIDIVPTSLVKKQQTQMTGSKTPRNSKLDYKSCSVNRSARKNEVLQRMRNIKKQIFKSLNQGEGGGCLTKVNHTNSSKAPRQKKNAVLIENVKILPNLREDEMTPLLNRINNFKKPVVNSITIKPIAKSVSPKNLADDQKAAKKSLQVSNNSSINDDEKFVKKSLKRPASSPLLSDDKPAKRHHKSPLKEQNELAEKPLELELTQWNLSESVVDFLQRDLKENRLNVESILNENLTEDDSSRTPDKTSVESNGKDKKIAENHKDESLISDILKQVGNEKSATEEPLSENSTDKDETQTNSKMFEDFDDLRDISLLAKFGLKIIKLPEIEDTISLEERDEMNEKATKFANIYKNWQRIWSTKNSESSTLKQELEISFNQFLAEANLSFNLNLNLEEVKRLANLINIWYTHNFSSKLIEKQKISDSVNRYLIIFHFIPRTIKRFFYCEYCEEYFNTEHKYFTHRIIHTGALYPYTCQKCSVGYRSIKQLKNHATSCNIVVNSRRFSLKQTLNTDTKTNTRSYKCHVCAELFATSELLYEHSKKHLKTIYNCAKCELVFATAIDVQNHMSICNAVIKRMPKQCTPRPAKSKAEPYSKK